KGPQSYRVVCDRVGPRKLNRLTGSLRPQRLHRINRSRTPRRKNTGNQRTDSQSNDGARKHHRVPSLHLIKLVRNQVSASNGYGNANCQPSQDLQKCPAQNQPDNLRPVRAQGHAYADFTRPALDRIGGNAVKSNSRQNEREYAKESSHLSHCTLLVKVGVNVFSHRLNIEQRDIRIDLTESMADLRLQSVHAAVQLEDNALMQMIDDGSHYIEGAVLKLHGSMDGLEPQVRPCCRAA